MEMTSAYLGETADAFEHCGFARETRIEPDAPGGRGAFIRTRHTLARPNERIVLEVCSYPDGAEDFFLEIEDFHGLSCMSFPLDSWRHHADRVEMKLRADPNTGQGFAFVLTLPAQGDPPRSE
jgi:hypothetical protein